MNTFKQTRRTHYNIENLLNSIKYGEQFDYLFFYDDGEHADATCLSPWFPVQFEVDGIVYKTAEHFMMANKANIFDDFDIQNEILACLTPREAKQLGRQVRNFDSQLWKNNRTKIVVRGNLNKFEQNPELKKYLISTAPSILVEASPNDSVWGIGMARENPDALDPQKCCGENLLGFALMEVRDDLIRESWRSIVNKCDPIYLIDGGAPEDEYDFVSIEIAKVALSCTSIEELASLIREKFVFAYDEMVRSENERFALASKELWELLHS